MAWEWGGFCPVCGKESTFKAKHSWFRGHLACVTCHSVPRERALMMALQSERPNWRALSIHESSPMDRGASVLLRRDCPKYVSSQYFPGIAPGTVHKGSRCENLEQQTFASETFDIVVTQDVMEHVFRPDRAHQEIWRTLKMGGVHIHTAPIYKDLVKSERRAEKDEANGTIHYLAAAEYHGNPVDEKGALVTFHYGYDYADLIANWASYDVEIRRHNDRTHGVVAEFTEVIICRKRRADSQQPTLPVASPPPGPLDG